MIQQLPQSTISQICTSVALQNLHSFVKELLENSIDGHSTQISVTFYDSGKNGLEISDNGVGIKYQEASNIATKGGTSKLQQWEDMLTVDTLGFRGEALNAISKLSHLRISTRHKDEEMGWTKCFTTGQIDHVAKEQGTTMIITDLFYSLPVRQLDFHSTYKSQYNKTFNLVTEYALIHPEIEFKVWNYEPPRLKSQVFHSGGVSTFPDRVTQVLGQKIFESLIEVSLSPRPNHTIHGYISKNIDSGSMGSASRKCIWYCYVNRRPINPPKSLLTMMSTIYRQYNPNGRIIFVLDFGFVNISEVDFNVSVDKRDVSISNFDATVKVLEKHLIDVLDLQKGMGKLIDEEDMKKNKKIKSNSEQTQKVDVIKKESLQVNVNESIQSSKKFGFLSQLPQKSQPPTQRQSSQNQVQIPPSIAVSQFQQQKVVLDDVDKNIDEKPADDQQIFDEIPFDQFGYKLTQDSIQFSNQGVSFKKNNFLDLMILGQYNKGFMVCLFEEGKQILILDQHACDEKKTYELLLKKFIPRPTTLMQSFNVQLQGYELELARIHEPKLNELGYKFKILQDSLEISALPQYGKHTFGPESIQTVISNLSESTDHDAKNILPKVKQILAMQACRSSIMIGQVLTTKDMRQLCDGMAILQAPWNCPHGRPTFIRVSEQLCETIRILQPSRGFSKTI